jgi:hypothetical protein
MGIGYQTLLKMLAHEGLRREAKRACLSHGPTAVSLLGQNRLLSFRGGYRKELRLERPNLELLSAVLELSELTPRVSCKAIPLRDQQLAATRVHDLRKAIKRFTWCHTLTDGATRRVFRASIRAISCMRLGDRNRGLSTTVRQEGTLLASSWRTVSESGRVLTEIRAGLNVTSGRYYRAVLIWDRK